MYFDNELFLKGVRPAINIFLSVTRVGRQTQDGLSRDTGSKIMKILKKHSELVRYLKFGTEISSQVKDLIDTGSRLFEFFKQVGYKTYPSKDSLKTAISIIEGKIKK